MLIPFPMTLGSSCLYSILLPLFHFPTFPFNSTPVQSSTLSPYHLQTTDQPTNPLHQFFLSFLSCQGFHPHLASSWPSSEVPSSSSLAVWPCPFSMVLYQSTCWPVGHLSFIMGLMSNSTWPWGHCLLKLVCQLYIVLTFSSVFNVINFCPFGGY